jgi:hypothetical protein
MVLGITPLQVMLENMRTLYANGHLGGAHKAAVDCAPYVHSKLVSSKVTVRRPDDMSDDELNAAIEAAESGGAAVPILGSLSSGTEETRH